MINSDKKTPAEKFVGVFLLQEKISVLKLFHGVSLLGEILVEDYIVEWDDEKNKINKQKHGVSFETAARVFLDEFSYDDYDELHSDFEDRIKIVGRVGEILAVIYTERGDTNRIISARHADKDERRQYYEQFY